MASARWRELVVQNDVDDARNGVGTVLGRGTVAQYFDLLDRIGRDLGKVRCLRAIGTEQRRAVHTFAIDQDQRVIRRKRTQAGRAHEDLTVCHRKAFHIEGRYELGQRVHNFVRRGQVDSFFGDDVYRREAVKGRARRPPRTGDDDRLLDAGIVLLGCCLGKCRVAEAQGGARCRQDEGLAQADRSFHDFPLMVNRAG